MQLQGTDALHACSSQVVQFMIERTQVDDLLDMKKSIGSTVLLCNIMQHQGSVPAMLGRKLTCVKRKLPQLCYSDTSPGTVLHGFIGLQGRYP